MLKVHELQKELRRHSDAKRAEISLRFFKTGPGQYGEGDVFLGLTVPLTRIIVKKYYGDLTLADVDTLLASMYHEERLAAVFILVHFAKKNTYPLSELAKFYLAYTHRINNWDLIDSSSEYIIGPYLANCMKHGERLKLINDCIESESVWMNRMVVLASFYQIKKGNEKMIFYVASNLLDHKHDLIHKAVGWMLREVGKRVSEKVLCEFLDTNATRMPRTMLRYAIEKLSEKKRKEYLSRPRVY